MAKKNTNTIGIILLVAGIGLLIWGINLYGAFGNKLARTLSGASTNETMTFLIAGAVCTVLGALMVFKK
jgi:Na+/phosphate symporter